MRRRRQLFRQSRREYRGVLKSWSARICRLSLADEAQFRQAAWCNCHSTLAGWREEPMKPFALALLGTLALSSASAVHAAEVKVLTAGAMQNVVTAVARDFERQTGHRVTIAYDTVGALSNRIQAGETFDV